MTGKSQAGIKSQQFFKDFKNPLYQWYLRVFYTHQVYTGTYCLQENAHPKYCSVDTVIVGYLSNLMLLLRYNNMIIKIIVE